MQSEPAALTAGTNAAATAIDRLDENELFRGLSKIVGHTTDEQHRDYVRELLAAKDWAREAGIRFEWAETDWVDSDSGEPYVCLKAWAGGALVGQASDRGPVIADNSNYSRHLRELAECSMAQCLKDGVRRSLNAGGEMLCDLASLDPTEAAAYLDTSDEINDDEAFEDLYGIVHRYESTDDHHTARIHAMIAAAFWAQAVEVTFRWERSGVSQKYDEPNRPVCRCLAYRNGELIGVSEDWDREVMLEPIHTRYKRWAEYELALAIMRDFDNPRDDYILTGDDV